MMNATPEVSIHQTQLHELSTPITTYSTKHHHLFLLSLFSKYFHTSLFYCFSYGGSQGWGGGPEGYPSMNARRLGTPWTSCQFFPGLSIHSCLDKLQSFGSVILIIQYTLMLSMVLKSCTVSLNSKYRKHIEQQVKAKQ